MAFEPLRTDYKDAVWAGLRKYLMLKNEDDTVSLKDVTQYTVYDDAFFGAEDANRINAAINAIMASVEKGTDLYEAFTAFFEAQKKAFTAEADKQNVDFGKYLDGLEQTADADIAKMKDDYTAEIKNFENTQEAVYNTWFDHIKDQLSDDAAGNLQAQIDKIPEWALQPTKPTYTATDVGAEPEGTVYDLIGVEKRYDGTIRSEYMLFDPIHDKIDIKDYYGKLADMIYSMSNNVANAMKTLYESWTPNRKSYSIGDATAADSILIADEGIITLRVYKISNKQLMAVNQYVYVSDTYGDKYTFVGKLAANTAALDKTYGTIAVSAADEAVKVASVKGYNIYITVMECLY